jgi:CHAT domain-containing protein
MAVRSSRSVALLPLLALLLLGAPVAVISPERAVSAARAAIDGGKLDQARTIVDGALRTYGNHDLEEVWTLRVMRAEVLLLTSADLEPAKNALRQELPPKYQHTEAAVRRLIYLGFAETSRKLLEDAETLAKQHQPHLLGEVYRAMAAISGDVDEARKAIRYARLYKQDVTEVKASVTLANNLMASQRFADAAEAGERAVETSRLPNVRQNAQGTLGWVYFDLGEYERAAELFAQAEATAATIPSTTNQAAWLVQLGNIEFQKRNYAGAERYNQRALTLAKDPKNRGYAYANLARVAFERGEFDKARELNTRAREAKKAAGGKEALLSSDIVEARILVAKERNFTGAEKLLLNVVSKGRKTRLEAQTELAKIYTGWKPDRAEKVFEDAVATALEQRSAIDKSELRLPFFNTVAELYDAYVDFLVDRNPVKALEVAEESRAESLEEGRGKTARRFDPKGIARQNGATFLSYWLGSRQSYLWVITAADVKLHRLASDATIERAVDRYQRVIRQGSPTTDGARLYGMLVAPAKIARGSRVIVIPDGRLHLLNFETLQPAADRYWIDDVILSSAPSLQLLTAKPRGAIASPSLLLVGNAPSPDPIAYPPLANAAREMRAIEKRFTKKTVLEGAKATPAAYRLQSPGKFDYLHFAAHGVAGSQRPLDSFIQLAPGGESYKLIARDIQNEPLTARLVTIASCEGAGTRTYAGEGVVGLAWAFLHAGADRVIASLWNVNDSATATLMDKMYAGIRNGDDPAVALRNAKRELMKTPGRAKPFYWAPFVLYGGT